MEIEISIEMEFISKPLNNGTAKDCRWLELASECASHRQNLEWQDTIVNYNVRFNCVFWCHITYAGMEFILIHGVESNPCRLPMVCYDLCRKAHLLGNGSDSMSFWTD